MPFKLRYHSEQKGDIVFVSNSILDYDGRTPQSVAELPPSGLSENNTTGYKSKYIDIDSSPETFSSSSADLNLPDCSTITFAGLYWGGSASNSNPHYSRRGIVKLKLPGSSEYIDISEDEAWLSQHFKDITALVKSAPSFNGTYTVANIVADQGMSDKFAGWTIVIAYKNNLKPQRDLSVFDGEVYVEKNMKQVSVSGFSTPPVGPVSVDFGFVAYDGDRGRKGDYLAVNGQPVFDQTHEQDNTFNSSISDRGQVVATRNPAFNNTLGYDASIITANNETYQYLSNNSHDATITVVSNNEGVYVGVLTSAIDIYNPLIQFTHDYVNLTSSKSTVTVGDVIEMTYSVKNTGKDYSTRTVFTDTIPSLMSFVKGSLEVLSPDGTWLKVTDEKDGDVGEYIESERKLVLRLGLKADALRGGEILASQELKIRYKMKATENCKLLYCGPAPISKFGWLSYSGNVNSSDSKIISSSPPSSLDGCSGSSAPLVIQWEPCAPEVINDLPLNILCKNMPVILPDGAALYALNDTHFTQPITALSEPGPYLARGLYPGGCTYTYHVIVTTDFLSIEKHPASVEVFEGDNASFVTEVKGGNASVQWQVDTGNGSWVDLAGGGGLAFSMPSVPFTSNGYRYRAKVTNGCSVIYSNEAVLTVKKIVVSPPPVAERDTLYVPNAFKPGSSVAELRQFMVKGHGIAKWKLRIFNKWDQPIWETDKLSEDGRPIEGWDGTMFGGPAPQGAYMWLISATFNDGREWQGSSGYFKKSKPKCSGVLYLLR
ncbi:hypothetical protein [Arcticibacter sp. MXS-1]|uniref:hypothetical protein n=1 Tax=Arcticibacter sp. MXS-1 TaxID=3341726 RepID=UPI0035A83198